MYKLLDWIDINKINWIWLSGNPNAIHLLEKNIDKIDWDFLSLNSSIFELDYDYLKEICHIYMEKLIQKTMHPCIIKKYLDLELDIEDF
jgi:hypothetical protein